MSNTLYYGDNLDVLRRHVQDESIDLIYLDPPFNSNATYEAFEDTWRWDQAAAEAYQEIVEAGEKPAQAMLALRQFLGDNDMLAYLSMMAPRLVELRQVLKPTGSIYLHCDPTASHYLKMLMDAVFGAGNFVNEVVWHYTGGGRSKRYFSNKHDTILWYRRGTQWTFNINAVRIPYKETSGYAKGGIVSAAGKKYMPHPDGTPADDVWDIPIINPLSHERIGYPTQKPEALLERIIQASSNEGDLVLDPFCGCGTTIAVAQRLNRRWIGIDVAHLAVTLTKRRLETAFGKVEYLKRRIPTKG